MAPSKWNVEKNEALLTSLGKVILSTATGTQKNLIEDNMEQAGYEGTTWEAIRRDWAAAAAATPAATPAVPEQNCSGCSG
ncbi:uncharacterized protein PG986_009720 [Apiospora aurea]|uniref:Uncharacterized protein n=1 Tax=Apiospora aurea TaxID=335848 RepID=A0ABR1Q8H1_9PEZI